MPKKFTEKMEWVDWKKKIINLLKYQPERNGFPFNYFIRYNVAAIVQTNTKGIDDYVDRTSLTGRFFNSDASKVRPYIFQLISENAVA